MSPIQQNDKQLDESINAAGCLFRSLSMLAEIHAQHTLGPDQIAEQKRWLVDNGYMLDEPGKRCWVMNHEKVINSALYYLGLPQTARYVFREEIDDRDFETGIKANAFIRHVRMLTGTGHFYVCNENGTRIWDPFWPAPAVDYVIGVRGYRIG